MFYGLKERRKAENRTSIVAGVIVISTDIIQARLPLIPLRGFGRIYRASGDEVSDRSSYQVLISHSTKRPVHGASSAVTRYI